MAAPPPAEPLTLESLQRQFEAVTTGLRADLATTQTKLATTQTKLATLEASTRAQFDQVFKTLEPLSTLPSLAKLANAVEQTQQAVLNTYLSVRHEGALSYALAEHKRIQEALHCVDPSQTQIRGRSTFGKKRIKALRRDFDALEKESRSVSEKEWRAYNSAKRRGAAELKNPRSPILILVYRIVESPDLRQLLTFCSVTLVDLALLAATVAISSFPESQGRHLRTHDAVDPSTFMSVIVRPLSRIDQVSAAHDTIRQRVEEMTNVTIKPKTGPPRMAFIPSLPVDEGETGAGPAAAERVMPFEAVEKRSRDIFLHHLNELSRIASDHP